MRTSIVHRRRAFTLMEVLIAIALLLVLSGVIFAFLRDLLASRDRIAEITARQRLASAVIEQIERQAIFTIVGDSEFGSGVSGDESSLTILSRRVAVHELASGGPSQRAFLDLTRTEYQFDENAHALQVRRQVPGVNETSSGDDLPQRPSGMDAAEAEGDSSFERFDVRLYRVRFRYHDGLQWLSEFDSLNAGRLPQAVEVAIWFEPWPGEEWNEPEPDPLAAPEEEMPERLTFDMEGAFDELDYATRADRDDRPIPQPDRIRVIAIPDAEEAVFDEPVDEEDAL